VLPAHLYTGELQGTEGQVVCILAPFMNALSSQILAIDALLPQTQCGKCGHVGCLPYAKALAQGAPINQCPPGGQATVRQLAQLLNVAELPLAQAQTPAQVALIREDECIGCTKCIQACPLDAIVGAAKWMHTVIADECSGCELCLAPCPVDCIDLLPLAAEPAAVQRGRSEQFRRRYQARQSRLAQQRQNRPEKKSRAAKPLKVIPPADSKRLKIELNMTRAALTKAEKQLARYGSETLQAQVSELRKALAAAERAWQESLNP